LSSNLEKNIDSPKNTKHIKHLPYFDDFSDGEKLSENSSIDGNN
jgi:hypothetical protein